MERSLPNWVPPSKNNGPLFLFKMGPWLVGGRWETKNTRLCLDSLCLTLLWWRSLLAVAAAGDRCSWTAGVAGGRWRFAGRLVVVATGGVAGGDRWRIWNGESLIALAIRDPLLRRVLLSCWGETSRVVFRAIAADGWPWLAKSAAGWKNGLGFPKRLPRCRPVAWIPGSLSCRRPPAAACDRLLLTRRSSSYSNESVA